MLYTYYCGHTVSGIRSCKVAVLILKYSKFSGICIHKSCKLGLKSGYMCSALLSKYIVTKSEYILLKSIYKLYSRLNLDIITYTLI